MKQSRIMSSIESTVNILVGLGVAMLANAIILPLVGFDVSLKQNAVIAVFMTVVSFVRSYGLRRLFEALHIRRPLSPFMQAVIAERYRQIEQEGWSIEHDDAHQTGELATAGACYAMLAKSEWKPEWGPHQYWPWSTEWWKPAGFRRDLVKGAALIVAEGEKFDRARKSKRPAQSSLTDDRSHELAKALTPIELAHGKTHSLHSGSSA